MLGSVFEDEDEEGFERDRGSIAGAALAHEGSRGRIEAATFAFVPTGFLQCSGKPNGATCLSANPGATRGWLLLSMVGGLA